MTEFVKTNLNDLNGFDQNRLTYEMTIEPV